MMQLHNKFFCALAAAMVICFSDGCNNGPVKEEAKAGKTDSVATFILKKEALNKEVSFPGELLPMDRAEVYAKVSGYIKTIQVDIGDKVQQGQVIAVLDAPEVSANFAQVNSDMQSAKSRYNGSLDAYKRIANAAKVDGTVALGELEKSRSQMQTDSGAYEAAKSKMEVYSQLRDYLTIRSPFAGVITQRNVDPGTLVGTNNAKPMFVIENNSTLRLRLPIPEAYTSANPDSSVIHFTVDAYPGITYKAKLSRKAGALSQVNRTETWEFLYTNKDNQLKSGMFANANIKFGRTLPTFVIPVSAVVTNLEKRFVIRLKSNKTEWVDVRNGIAPDNRVEVFGNLTEGDTLILRGTDEIKPGKEFIPKF
jgi:RND family efflux transporter MFP subunit